MKSGDLRCPKCGETCWVRIEKYFLTCDGVPSHDFSWVPDPTSAQDKVERRKDLRCSFCPPNKGENTKRRAKHGAKKPKTRGRR